MCLGASEATVNDVTLAFWQGEKLRRVRGGAEADSILLLMWSLLGRPYSVIKRFNTDVEAEYAKAAVDLLQTICLLWSSGGTTTSGDVGIYCAGLKLQVLTNFLLIAESIVIKKSKCSVTGASANSSGKQNIILSPVSEWYSNHTYADILF